MQNSSIPLLQALTTSIPPTYNHDLETFLYPPPPQKNLATHHLQTKLNNKQQEISSLQSHLLNLHPEMKSPATRIENKISSLTYNQKYVSYITLICLKINQSLKLSSNTNTPENTHIITFFDDIYMTLTDYEFLLSDRISHQQHKLQHLFDKLSSQHPTIQERISILQAEILDINNDIYDIETQYYD